MSGIMNLGSELQNSNQVWLDETLLTNQALFCFCGSLSETTTQPISSHDVRFKRDLSTYGCSSLVSLRNDYPFHMFKRGLLLGHRGMLVEQSRTQPEPRPKKAGSGYLKPLPKVYIPPPPPNRSLNRLFPQGLRSSQDLTLTSSGPQLVEGPMGTRWSSRGARGS